MSRINGPFSVFRDTLLCSAELWWETDTPFEHYATSLSFYQFICTLLTRKQEKIVEAMRHSWSGYVQYAWGFDELMPLSKSGKNSFGGLGATVVDSLDTLWLMGLKEEFKQARDWVVNELTFNKCTPFH